MLLRSLSPRTATALAAARVGTAGAAGKSCCLSFAAVAAARQSIAARFGLPACGGPDGRGFAGTVRQRRACTMLQGGVVGREARLDPHARLVLLSLTVVFLS